MSGSIFLIVSYESFFLVTAAVMIWDHIRESSNNASSFNPCKVKIKRGFTSIVGGRNYPNPIGYPVSAAPTITEYIVKRHDGCHLQVHTEIRRQHCTVAGKVFNVAVWILLDKFETGAIKKWTMRSKRFTSTRWILSKKIKRRSSKSYGFSWAEWPYKIGDPVLFNDSKRSDLI